MRPFRHLEQGSKSCENTQKKVARWVGFPSPMGVSHTCCQPAASRAAPNEERVFAWRHGHRAPQPMEAGFPSLALYLSCSPCCLSIITLHSNPTLLCFSLLPWLLLADLHLPVVTTSLEDVLTAPRRRGRRRRRRGRRMCWRTSVWVERSTWAGQPTKLSLHVV